AVAGPVADGVIIQLADPEIIQWIMATARRAAEEAGRDPAQLKCIVGAPAHITDDLADAREQVRWFPAMVSNHVMDLIERYGADGSSVPKALTDYVQARKFYDYNEHSRVGAKHGEFVTDEICDRFCVLGTTDQIKVKLKELEGVGVDQFNIYLMTHGQEETLQAYGDEIIPGTPHVARRGTLLAYATNRRNGSDFDIVARHLGSGEEQTFEIGGYCGVESVSPDGRWIVVERTGERSADNDLFLVDVESGDVVHATPHVDAAEYYAPVWLADRSGFLLATNAGRDTFAIARHDLAAGTSTVVHESEWDLEPHGDEAGRTVLVIANEDGYSRLELRDPQTLELREHVPLPGRGVVEHPVFSRDGALLAFSFSNPVEPHDVYVYDLDRRALERLTTSPRAVEPATLVEPTLHRFESFDGESVPVFLFEPEGAGPFPVVVTVHGGPESQWLPWFAPSFAPLTQHLVSRGYAVAAPNVRGSTGYGKRYSQLDDVEKRLDSVRDLESLHEWLDARPEIDGSRAVVYGRSYGGY